MPVYEFECPKGTVTERLVSLGTKSISCPCCHKRAKKILSLCSFDLKGGGWYADGYSSGGSGTTGNSKSSSTTSTDSKTTETKKNTGKSE